jgi:hypothetical protein
MGGKFDSQLWFNAISDYTLHDYCEMTSNNEGQSCEALPSLLHSVESCFVFFFSFFFLFSRDRGRVPRLLCLFLFFLLNEVTEDCFFLPRLPQARALARCSAAWQFNVVPDRGRIRRLGQKVVPGPAAAASFFGSSCAHYPIFLLLPFVVGQASLGPVLAGAPQKSTGNQRQRLRPCPVEIGPCSSLQWTDFVVCIPRR